MKTKLLCLALLLFSCGHRAQATSTSPSQETPAGNTPYGAPLLIAANPTPEKNLLLVLSRLETKTEAPPLEISSDEPIIIPESDPAFARVVGALKSYPGGVSYWVYSSLANMEAKVSGVALVHTACGDSWAAYPVLTTSALISEEAVLVRVAEGVVASHAARLLPPTNSLPEALRATISKISDPKEKRYTTERYFVRVLELDGDPGAEAFVARLLLEPLGDESARAAKVESFWLDEAQGGWKALHTSKQSIAQEDLSQFSESGWEKVAAPPILVVETNGSIDILRQTTEGYSLWRTEKGKLTMVASEALASKEICD